MNKLISYLIMFQMVAVPFGNVAHADPSPQPTGTPQPKALPDNSAVIRELRQEIKSNPSGFYVESETNAAAASLNKALAQEGVDALIKQLQDPSVSLDSIRETLITKVQEEEEAQLIELKYVIQALSSEGLDRIFEQSMEHGIYGADVRMDYEAAYTGAEKRAVVLAMAASDLFRLKSLTLKRLGILDRDGLVKELRATSSLINVKDGDAWKVALVVVLAVVAAGFVSWAIVSATKAHWERRTTQTETDYRNREQQLQQDYANKEQQLQAEFQKRAELRDQGYVWQVCQSTTTDVAVACTYDGATHSGTQVCITHCLKSPTTGDEQMPATSCSSAYIPSNCLQPNPYSSGYNDGYGPAYHDAYMTEYDAAYHDAYHDYYLTGYHDGYVRGYDDGYNVGYTDGLNQAQYDASRNHTKSVKDAGPLDDVGMGYQKGYREGYAIATQIRLGA